MAERCKFFSVEYSQAMQEFMAGNRSYPWCWYWLLCFMHACTTWSRYRTLSNISLTYLLREKKKFLFKLIITCNSGIIVTIIKVNHKWHERFKKSTAYFIWMVISMYYCKGNFDLKAIKRKETIAVWHAISCWHVALQMLQKKQTRTLP